MEDLSSVESVKSKDQPGVSLDNESGYEDGLSDGNEVSSPHTPDLSLTENIDSLIADTSVLTLQTDTDNSLNTRPPSAVSFASSVGSVGSKRSRIPVRTLQARRKPARKTNSTVRAKTSDEVATPSRKISREPAKKNSRKKTPSKPLEIWEIQQSLKRGEFVEGILTVGGGRDGLICAPVTIDRGGRLDWR